MLGTLTLQTEPSALAQRRRLPGRQEPGGDSGLVAGIPGRALRAPKGQVSGAITGHLLPGVTLSAGADPEARASLAVNAARL